MFCTESEVYELMRDALVGIEAIPAIFVMKREPIKGNPYKYKAIFAIQTQEGNEALLKSLMFLHDDITFAGSEVDVQGQSTILDFLYFEVLINLIKG